MKSKLLLALIGVMVFGGWWTYQLVWGKPLNINHFYERVMIEVALDNPQMLSHLGLIENTLLDFHSDELSDASPAHAQQAMEKAEQDFVTLQSYQSDQLTEAQQLSKDILAWFYDDILRGKAFAFHNYPVKQLFGEQSNLPSFMDATHQVIDKRSAENYISRLSKFGIKFDQVLEGLKIRESKQIIPPKFVIKKVLAEMRNFAALPAKENILFSSFTKKLTKVESLNDQDKQALKSEVRKQIEQQVYPAYQRLISYFAALESKANNDDGVWKLPDGDAYYAYQLRHHTSSDYTPAEVHDIGLKEVARIQSEMQQILESLGYQGKTVSEHMLDMAAEPQFLFADSDEGREQILQQYQQHIDEIDKGLSAVFSVRPKVGVEVKRIPVFKEKTAPGAYYDRAPMDGSRPGVFYVNLRDVKELPKFSMRTLAYHEAVPGHHFQIGIQQELQDLPTFRSIIRFTAYVEGWALYAERLAWEYGFQNDAYSNLGRLQAELFRAVRLVVDTGIHYKRWPRQQAIDYMQANTGAPEGDVISEIERYIVMPGQACAYKIGMIKILELREKSKQQLGDQFDIREFHDVVLKNGSLPLNILERLVDRYIKEKTQA